MFKLFKIFLSVCFICLSISASGNTGVAFSNNFSYPFPLTEIPSEEEIPLIFSDSQLYGDANGITKAQLLRRTMVMVYTLDAPLFGGRAFPLPDTLLAANGPYRWLTPIESLYFSDLNVNVRLSEIRQAKTVMGLSGRIWKALDPSLRIVSSVK